MNDKKIKILRHIIDNRSPGLIGFDEVRRIIDADDVSVLRDLYPDVFDEPTEFIDKAIKFARDYMMNEDWPDLWEEYEWYETPTKSSDGDPVELLSRACLSRFPSSVNMGDTGPPADESAALTEADLRFVDKRPQLLEKADVFHRAEVLWNYLDSVDTARPAALADVKQAIFYLVTTVEYQQREIVELRERLDFITLKTED